MKDTLRINEIFLSIQGESTFAGWPCVIVRTTGCPLRCSWCDTKYAYDEGTDMPLAEVVERAVSFGVRHVEVTGGEPLAQPLVPALLRALCDKGKTVLLETSGAIDISSVDERVHVIMDIKCPDSGMTDRMRLENISLLKAKDEVKFVLASRGDYEFARRIVREYGLPERCTVLFSTSFDLMDRKSVVEWMLEDRLPVRFRLQMHKFIWAPDQRGV
ncbi:MAG: radical SAM protein [Vicinamibacterales bacterium]